jgi:hypothetical protein
MDRGMMDMQHNALSFDEAAAALPHAPLAMPKQVVEVERGRLIAALLARLVTRPLRSEG